MSPREVWRQVLALKAGGAVMGSLVVGGVVVGFTFGGYVGLPDRVSAVESVNARQDSAIVEGARRDMIQEQRDRRVLCLLEVIAEGANPLRCER